jgi:hypothetical protein
VLSARVPRPGTAYTAYLLSLEHRLDALPAATPTPGAGMGPAEVADPGTGSVSFPVLAHWRFRCAEAGDFQALMEGLDVGSLGTVRGDCPAVAPTGHVVVAHRTRRGEEAAAWYRPPLTPREVRRRPARQPYVTADQARAIAQDGLEDLSEAAAFELGRLLAMSSPRFLAELLAWRRATMATDTVAAALDRLPGVTALGLDHTTVTQGLGLAAIDRLAGPEDPLGPRVPLTDAGWALRDFPLERIATGFGLNPSLVKQLLAGAALEPDPVPPGPARPHESTFDGLAAAPQLLAPLRDALRRRVRQLAVAAGLDPDTATFDPAFAPTTIDQLYGGGGP